MLSLSAVHIHRMHQLATAKDDLDFYRSLKHFRNAASQRFKRSMTMLIDALIKGHTADDDAHIQAPPAAVVTPRNPTPPRATRSAADIERIQLPRLNTGKTPQRNVKKKIQTMVGKLEQGRIDNMSRVFLARAHSCVGFHVIRKAQPCGSTKGSRGTCANCSAQTYDYCLGCHRWLCNNARTSDKASELEDWKSHIIISNPLSPTGEEDVHCHATCMLHCHRGQQGNVLRTLESNLCSGAINSNTTAG